LQRQKTLRRRSLRSSGDTLNAGIDIVLSGLIPSLILFVIFYCVLLLIAYQRGKVYTHVRVNVGIALGLALVFFILNFTGYLTYPSGGSLFDIILDSAPAIKYTAFPLLIGFLFLLLSVVQKILAFTVFAQQHPKKKNGHRINGPALASKNRKTMLLWFHTEQEMGVFILVIAGISLIIDIVFFFTQIGSIRLLAAMYSPLYLLMGVIIFAFMVYMGVKLTWPHKLDR
jgi:hypothetical protein